VCSTCKALYFTSVSCFVLYTNFYPHVDEISCGEEWSDFCAEVVHILSSDDEEDKAATSNVTTVTQSTSAAASAVASTSIYQAGLLSDMLFFGSS